MSLDVFYSLKIYVGSKFSQCDWSKMRVWFARSQPTDTEWRFTEKGDRVRVSVRTGRIIPLPSGAKELDDFVNPLTYVGKSSFLSRIVQNLATTSAFTKFLLKKGISSVKTILKRLYALT